MADTVTTSAGDLEQELARLGEQETFPPPAEFRNVMKDVNEKLAASDG
jgi:hypothetical protein